MIYGREGTVVNTHCEDSQETLRSSNFLKRYFVINIVFQLCYSWALIYLRLSLQ